MKSKQIVIGLSGGVDSTLTALLLQQQGFDVTGVILKIDKDRKNGIDENSCGGNQSVKRAQISADELGIPLHIIDCSGRFEDLILRNCWQAFENGTTPNPCYACNAQIKFIELFNTAKSLGADKIATGHYARIDYDSNKQPVLKRGVDKNKDQSYFLSGLSPEILLHTLFPLGSMLKKDVKKAAEKYGLSSSALKESQDLCFAGPEGHFSNMLRERYAGQTIPGVFMNEAGQILREHNGIHQFTIGQRRGLGFATGERVKITSIDPETGTIIVSGRKEAAYSENCTVNQFKWSREIFNAGDKVMAQVRYRQRAAEAVIKKSDNGFLQIGFTQPVFGVTPGQILVLYRDDCVLGSGIISR